MQETKTEKTLSYVAMGVNTLLSMLSGTFMLLWPNNALLAVAVGGLAVVSNALMAMGYTKGRSLVKMEQIKAAASISPKP